MRALPDRIAVPASSRVQHFDEDRAIEIGRVGRAADEHAGDVCHVGRDNIDFRALARVVDVIVKICGTRNRILLLDVPLRAQIFEPGDEWRRAGRLVPRHDWQQFRRRQFYRTRDLPGKNEYGHYRQRAAPEPALDNWFHD